MKSPSKLSPALLAVAMLTATVLGGVLANAPGGLPVDAASWAAGAIQWWLALVILVFCAFALVSMIRQNRR